MLFFRVIPLIVILIPLIADAKEPNDIQTKKSTLEKTTRISPQPLLNVVEDELKLFRTMEIDKAYQDHTTREFRQKTSLAEFKTLVDKYKVLSNSARFQFQSFYVENDIVTLGGELHAKDGVVVPVEFDFVMEDSQWKIMGIQIYQNELPLPPTKH